MDEVVVKARVKVIQSSKALYVRIPYYIANALKIRKGTEVDVILDPVNGIIRIVRVNPQNEIVSNDRPAE
ncbi:MAG: hypothetical protein NZ957_05790 [Thaumarchaeota archaeon]|nr:hypothetical protein [Candidatus Calditenuaceae archaeon]